MKLSNTCDLPDASTALRRAWAVMEDEHSSNQKDRILILLKTFLSAANNQVLLGDLQIVTKVLVFLAERAELSTSYHQQLQEFLNLLKQPPMMSKSSDEIEYQTQLVIFFNQLGLMLLQPKNADLKPHILEIVQNMLAGRDGAKGFLPVRACLKAVEVSELMEYIADLIAISSKDIYLLAVSTALQVCNMSKLCCWSTLRKGLLENLLVRMRVVKDEERIVVWEMTYELLWKLFCCTNHREDWSQVPQPSIVALRSLRYVLREEALVHGLPGRLTNGLNNISAITLKTLHLFPSAEYVLSGLLEDITSFATLTEAVINFHVLVPRFKTQSDHLMFKKLMIACLAICPATSASKVIFQHHKVAECLTFLLCTERRTYLFNEIDDDFWSAEHMMELFRCALPTIVAIYDTLQKDFIDAGLFEKLILFLSENSINDKPPTDDLLHDVVSTVMALCFHDQNAKHTREALEKANSVVVLLSICKHVLASNFQMTVRLQKMLSYMLCVLTYLMENQDFLQQMHSEACSYIVNTLYQRILKPLPSDSLIDKKLTISVCNFAWETLIWNKQNVKEFLSSSNVFSHIDILERSSVSEQIIYLSMLADIAELRQSIPYLVTWRGKKGINLLSLLCNIWREEEKRFEVPRSEDGCISDIERPLMGEKQFKTSGKENKLTLSTCDLFGSVRPKIHAIVQLMDRYREVEDLCEDQYKLGHDKLSCENTVTLQTIRAYLPLKLGEVWWEIRSGQEQVTPLDRYLAETLSNHYLDTSLAVQKAQHALMREWDTQQCAEEAALYRGLHEARLTTALQALQQVIVIARTADRQMMSREYVRQWESIEEYRAPVQGEVRATYPRDLPLLLVHSKTDLVLQEAPPVSAP